MPIELLSFDLDDTLWPCLPTILRAENLLYEWMQQHVPDIARHHDLESLREQRKRFIQANPQLAHDLTEIRLRSMRELSAEHDHHDDWVEDAFRVFFEARQDVEFYEEVATVLDRLSGRYRLAALSNGNADIEQTGIHHWMEFSISAEQAGVAKPHPDIFGQLLEHAGVDASQVVHIGDHPEHDILGAAGAGLHSIWVNREGRAWPHRGVRASREIRHLGELESALAGLEQAR